MLKVINKQQYMVGNEKGWNMAGEMISKTAHLEEMKAILKQEKAAFWKYAALASACIEQEYAVYEILAKGCFFDMTRYLGKAVKRFWQSVPTGYSMDDSYLLAIEESIFQPRDEWEETALQIVRDMEQAFYAFFDKKAENAFELLNRQLMIAEKCAKLSEMSQESKDAFLKKIFTDQRNMVMEIAAVPNKEKKTFLGGLQSRNWKEAIDLTALISLRPVRNEKPEKKKLPEIRNTSVDFDMFAKKRDDKWLLDATPEQWVFKIWEELGLGGTYEAYYKEKKLAQFCHIMRIMYYSYSERDYAANRMPERVRGFWYLCGFTTLCTYELVKQEYPAEKNSNLIHDMSWHADSILYTAMLFAYAAGTDDLIPRLYSFAKGVCQNQPYTRVKDLVEIINGVNNEKLYDRIAQWEKCDMKEMLLWILKGDAGEFRKALLHSVRHRRKMYDMCGDLLDPWAYACVKIAKKHGIEVEPVRVAELLDYDFDETPVDRQKWRLPLQDEIDEWLKEKKE